MNWEVVLTGDKSDLEELSKVFKDKDLSIVQENEQFILESEDFDVLSNYAEELALDSRKVIDYPAMPVVNWIKLAQRDKSVKKIFDQINHDFNSWDAFHKIIEILEDDQFEHVRKKQKGIKEGKYRSEVNGLTGTANSYKTISFESRHAREFEPPENPMHFSEAKSFIKLILHEWLAHKERELIFKKE